MITDLYIYNIDKKTYTRRTLINKVYAITSGTIGSEFIIHIPDEYDYRYASDANRNEILAMIIRARGI